MIDAFYADGINPIVWTEDTKIWGQKTLENPALDRVSTRKVLVNIEKFVEKHLQQTFGDLNNDLTRKMMTNQLYGYLSYINSKRGIDDYKIVCDETNNTCEDIDNNRLNLDLYIQPRNTPEFINLSFKVHSRGVSFDELNDIEVNYIVPDELFRMD